MDDESDFSEGIVLHLPAALLEAARHLGCKRQRIYDLVARRQASAIPHRKEGARLLFRLSELDRWIERGGAA